MQQKGIHWFPGHMQKAMREIQERLKLIDVIVEIVDSRAPRSSKNPFLEIRIKEFHLNFFISFRFSYSI